MNSNQATSNFNQAKIMTENTVPNNNIQATREEMNIEERHRNCRCWRSGMYRGLSHYNGLEYKKSFQNDQKIEIFPRKPDYSIRFIVKIDSFSVYKAKRGWLYYLTCIKEDRNVVKFKKQTEGSLELIKLHGLKGLYLAKIVTTKKKIYMERF